jgi:hypothetical protein
MQWPNPVGRDGREDVQRRRKVKRRAKKMPRARQGRGANLVLFLVALPGLFLSGTNALAVREAHALV